MKVSAWQARKNDGLCSDCDEPAVRGSWCCQVHLDIRAVRERGRARSRRAERRMKGLCLICGSSDNRPGKMYCQLCADKRASRNYGISLETYQSMPKRCWICGSTERLCLDHDHACHPDVSRGCEKCVRGFLCNQCNGWLITVLEHPDALKALDYLRNTRSSAPLLAYIFSLEREKFTSPATSVVQ